MNFQRTTMLDAFDITSGDFISVVGCNGKTTLMRRLALDYINSKPGRSALIGTTTKLGADQIPDHADIFYSLDELEKAHEEQRAQPLASITGPLYKGMLTTPGISELEKAASYYDIASIEADGSRTLPIKAWRDHEPPIHPATSLTIGILPIQAYGIHPTPENTHAYDTFTELYGTVDTVDAALMKEVIMRPDQMFKNSPGKKVFFLNKVDSEAQVPKALKIVEELRDAGVTIDIVFGSVLNGIFYR
ncbi:MAG: selenium cofactor biosynthesis protein YqeC [Coriobacteriia bacterium]|nr:selenium cofactor biosynthesis protein YqeC [Coriobacteriia bacterium]